MAVKESEKTYIECRMIILGEKNVGKKSFIGKLLSVSSTSMIRNYEAEKEFNKKLDELRKRVEREEELLIQSEQEKYRTYNTKSDSNILDNSLTKNKKQNNRSKSKESEEKKIHKEKKENIGYKVNFLPSKIAKSKIYHRPPLPEFPSKLFNVYKAKMVFKPYFISPAEDLLYSSNNDDEDSDYEFEKKYKLTVKGVKKDIDKVINGQKTVIEVEKLSGYKIYVYNMFIFIYDMTDYSSFETIIKYFDRLETKYNITKNENFLACVIGNKKDKNILFNEENSKTLYEFIDKYNLKHYEISTKPFYDFAKFYSQLIIDNLSPMHKFFEENNFKQELKKLIENKQSFSKAIRASLENPEKNPGPEYDLNIYSFNSMKELSQALINKKTRFTKKIFANKQGPIIYNSKSTKEINTDNKDKKSIMYITSGGIINKPIVGYTFGLVKGRLNLVKSRRELNKERNKSFKESLEQDGSFNIQNSTMNTKPEIYFEQASFRKNLIQSKRIIERQQKMEKLDKIHQDNLNRIAAEKEAQKNMIIPRIQRSSSAPDINITNENKKRYYDIVYGKNKEYLYKFNKRRIEIEKEKIREEKEMIKMMEIEREKQKQIEKEKEIQKREEMLRKEKYRLKKNVPKVSTDFKTFDQEPNYPVIKDDFEILVEKNKKRNVIMREFKPRFEEIKQEKINNPYNDESIWKRWEENKLHISNKGRIKKFLQGRKKKELEHKLNMKNIEKQAEEIQKIRREIIMEKGYEDPLTIKEINYSQVEESSPKYTIKGRNIPRKRQNSEDTNNFLLGQDQDIIDYIKNIQMTRPLPNINCIKPNMPNVIFPKAERFIKYKTVYEGTLELFKDGNFAPKTKEDFNKQGTFSKNENRSLAKKEKSPSPCDYKIKSSFEIIAEQGKIISKVRENIKKNEEIEKANRQKRLIQSIIEKEKEQEKVKEKEKEKEKDKSKEKEIEKDKNKSNEKEIEKEE